MIIIADKILIRTDREPLIHGAVVVQSGLIRAIGPVERILRRYPGHRTLTCMKSVVLPGLVNVHTHLELPPLRAGIRPTSYVDWVLNLIKSRSRWTKADHVRAADMNIISLLHTGTTTVGEICTYGCSPALIKRYGMRSVIFHEVVSMEPESFKPASSAWKFRSTRLVQHGLSPHSVHTVSESALSGLRDRVRKRGMPLCMHVAETAAEGDLLRRSASSLDRLYAAVGWKRDWAPQGRSSIAYLGRMGVLNDRFLAVHAVHTDGRDRALIKETHTAVAHCPRSNRALQAGVFPLRKFLSAGITVGLGTDSLASVASLSLWDEMRAALRMHRKAGVSARQLLELATLGGAKALGLDRIVGSLETGKQADLIAVPLPRRCTGDLSSDLLRETKSCTMTMVNGKLLYRAEDPLR